MAAIGLSLLSGAHNELFKRVINLLQARGAEDFMVFGGGIIPATDISGLRDMEVSAVFTSGASAKEITATIDRLLPANQEA